MLKESIRDIARLSQRLRLETNESVRKDLINKIETHKRVIKKCLKSYVPNRY